MITIDRDGAVWVGSGEYGGEECRVSMLRSGGAAWVRRAVAGCPPGSSGLSSLAVDANGDAVGGMGGWAPGSGCGFYLGCPAAGLARLDGQSWDAIRELGGSELTHPTIVGTTRTGDMRVVDDPTAFWDPAGTESPVRAARFDGTDWTVVELPEGSTADIVVAPDGTLWASTWWWVPASTGSGDRGPAQYDGTACTFPYDGVGLPWMQLAAVAPDGTVFGAIAGSIFRSLDRPPRP